MILVFAGTKDGREIINSLLKQRYRLIASTATEYGSSLLANHPNLKKLKGKLNLADMKDLVKKEKVSIIIDVTHPYAVEVSQNILQLSRELKIQTIRYERASVKSDLIKEFNSYIEIINYLKHTKGNILLTIGANNLKLITNSIDNSRLYARILPLSSSLIKAEQAGLTAKQIIAVQGPCTIQFNGSMLEQFNIKYLVTKDSGSEGGLYQKLEAAKYHNVEVLMLKRPQLPYPCVVDSLAEIMKKLRKGDILC